MKNNKVTLIYASIGIIGMGNKNSRNGEVVRMPHGLASIAASVKAAGYMVDLIDVRIVDDWEEFKDKIIKSSSCYFGISIDNVSVSYGIQVAKIIKEIKQDSYIVVGGLNPSLFPETYDGIDTIDFVMKGEGEISMVKLFEKLDNGKKPNRFIIGIKPDLDKIPWVDRELFDYKRELMNRCYPGQKRPIVTMLAGRGCPYRCTFCQGAEREVFGLPFRIRSPRNVIDELIELKKKYNFRNINFWDDTFTLNPKWVFEFCDLYEKQNFQAGITACSRADIICRNEEMVKRLVEVGLQWFQIGYESGSQRILDFLKKDVTVKQNYKAAAICKKYGIKVTGTFMFGLPTETKEEAVATVKMILDIKPDHPTPFYFIPAPGTEIYQYCVDNDLILNKDKSIARTGMYEPAIKGIDYEYLNYLRKNELSKLPFIVKAFIK